MRHHGATHETPEAWGNEPAGFAGGTVPEDRNPEEEARAETEARQAPAEKAPACVIVGIPAANALFLWPRVKHYFASFEDRSDGFVKAEDLIRAVVEKRRQMWLAVQPDGWKIKACGLTEVSPGLLVFDFCAGTDRHEWRDMMVDEICRWAKHMECRQVRIICRPGWAREIKGFRESHRVLERNI